MNDTETLQTIGNLIKTARMQFQASQLALAKQANMDVQTLRKMERGEGMVQSVAQAKVEKALGWRIGSINELWEERADLVAGNVTLEDMGRHADEPGFQQIENGDKSPVMKASLLSDEELLAEIAYRFRNYKVQLNGEA